jgi:RNA polymerase sigma factor (sigma-70 family)
MATATKASPPSASTNRKAPSFIYHSTFEEPDAGKLYGSIPPQNDGELIDFMRDEATRDWTKRMHYAAWRASKAGTSREASRWWRRYYDCRDRVVLGNRKLTFRAVQKWRPAAQLVEDLAAECQIVLIKAVAAFNPWLGIRFSTYAFTCLLRALSRSSQRQAADRLFRSVSLDSLPFGESPPAESAESSSPDITTLEKYFRAENSLLTEREKSVLVRRYRLHEDASKSETLQQVGKELGLSKERVRQLQMSALGKLRHALSAT